MNDTRSAGQTALDRLAALYGILPAYYDVSGGQHFTSSETKRALLATMSVDASTDAAASAALEVVWTGEAGEHLTLIANLSDKGVAAPPQSPGETMYATPADASVGGTLGPWSAHWYLHTP